MESGEYFDGRHQNWPSPTVKSGIPNIFILQARPETVWSEKRKAEEAGAPKATSAMDYILSSLLTGKKVT